MCDTRSSMNCAGDKYYAIVSVVQGVFMHTEHDGVVDRRVKKTVALDYFEFSSYFDIGCPQSTLTKPNPIIYPEMWT